MGHILLQRIASILIFAALFVVAAVRTTLDLVGWSTAPDDVGVAVTRLDQFFAWLLSLPFWMPWAFALAAMALLFIVVWPRTVIVRNTTGGIAEFSKGQELTPSGIGIMLKGLDQGECSIMIMLGLRNRSPHDMKLMPDEAIIYIDGKKLDLGESKLPVQITADSTANVPVYSGRFERYNKEARGTFRATIRFGRDARCSSAVTFGYEFHLVAAPGGGWNVIDPVPQTLTLLEYSLKT